MAPTLHHDGSTAPKETLSEVQTSPATDSPDSNAPFGDGAENETDSPSTEKAKKPAFNRDWRFWMIMVTLVISTLLSSLESTVVITSLPTIVADLKIGSDYIWITNVYFLTRRVPRSHVRSATC